MKIVPIALKKYFVDNISIRETILNHNDIFDFCLRLKVNSKSSAYFKYLKDNDLTTKKLDRTTRYYISNNGGNLYKKIDNSRIVFVNVGYSATLFNNYIKKDMKDYNINYRFYITECYKIANIINEGRNPGLFDNL